MIIHIYTARSKEVEADIADVVLVRNMAVSRLIISLFTFRICKNIGVSVVF